MITDTRRCRSWTRERRPPRAGGPVGREDAEQGRGASAGPATPDRWPGWRTRGRECSSRRLLGRRRTCGPRRLPLSGGQPLTDDRRPSWRTRRTGRPSSMSLGTARLPRRPRRCSRRWRPHSCRPRCDTRVQYGAAQSPVAGSMMWCRRRPPRCHVRTEVLDVAPSHPARSRPPGRRRRLIADESVAMPTAQPPSGAVPGDGDVAADAHEDARYAVPCAIRCAARSATRALADAPRSRWVPVGIRTVRWRGSSSICHQPGAGRGGVAELGVQGVELVVVPVVPERLDGAPHGGVHGSTGASRDVARHRDGVEEKGAHLDAGAVRPVQGRQLRVGPEPAAGRGRWRRSSSRRIARALSTLAGSVTATIAVVPMARMVRSVGLCSSTCRDNGVGGVGRDAGALHVSDVRSHPTRRWPTWSSSSGPCRRGRWSCGRSGRGDGRRRSSRRSRRELPDVLDVEPFPRRRWSS